MLIEEYEIELHTPACHPAASIYAATVTLARDISEVLPYVNGTVEKGLFLAGVPTLVWVEGCRKYALRPREIAVSNLADREQASEVVRAVVDRINQTWENREDLEPSYDSWEKPKVLDILKLLPGTNCRKCGAATCMAFAAQLAEGERCLEECPPLGDEDFAANLSALREIGL